MGDDFLELHVEEIVQYCVYHTYQQLVDREGAWSAVGHVAVGGA